MFFLVSAETIHLFQGALESLDPQQALKTEVALEVVECYEQKLIWVPEGAPAGKQPKGRAKPAGEVVAVVELRNGELREDKVNLNTPREDIFRIYPVKARYVRQFVAVPIDLPRGEGEGRDRKRSRTSKPTEGPGG